LGVKKRVTKGGTLPERKPAPRIVTQKKIHGKNFKKRTGRVSDKDSATEGTVPMVERAVESQDRTCNGDVGVNQSRKRGHHDKTKTTGGKRGEKNGPHKKWPSQRREPGKDSKGKKKALKGKKRRGKGTGRGDYLGRGKKFFRAVGDPMKW